MKRVVENEQVRVWCDQRRREGRRLGFVPTMGALHDGHVSLIRHAREQSDDVVVSIFVNPLQFAPHEDLDRYPRNLERDAELCAAEGVGLIFAPTPEGFYPRGFQTSVEVGPLAQSLCGERRPGHFRGVCTVVARLFGLVGSCAAFFGQKDYQQLLVVRQMARDLALPVDVIGCPTVRESDGLALSSRNAYLDSEQRRAATVLWRALSRVASLAQENVLSAEHALRVATELIAQEPAVRIDYLDIRHPETLELVDQVVSGGAVVLVAAHVGATRLIDNVLV